MSLHLSGGKAFGDVDKRLWVFIWKVVQWLWSLSELQLLAVAIALAFYEPEVPVASKERLKAVLMQAQEFLVQVDWFQDQRPRDHQARMMLNYLLGHKRVSETSR